MRRILLLNLFIFFSFVLFGQESEKKIRWKEDRPLVWKDFQAEPDKTKNSYSANTNSGISYSWNYSTSTGVPILTHEVHANFYPERSWVKDIEDEEYLLAHEQLHFDISELHARKMRKALDEYEIGRNIRQDLKRLYNKIEAERVSMQNKFDKETSHSEIRDAEMRWRDFVKQELKKLENYSS